MLILADTDALRIDLDQLRERIHQASADGHRAAHGDVAVRELRARDLGGGVHRGARFVHHHHRNVAWKSQLADEGLRFTPASAVADGDRLHLVLSDQTGEGVGGLAAALLTLIRVDDGVVNEPALCVEHHRFAAGAHTRVDGQHPPLAQRRCEQQLPQVL